MNITQEQRQSQDLNTAGHIVKRGKKKKKKNNIYVVGSQTWMNRRGKKVYALC